MIKKLIDDVQIGDLIVPGVYKQYNRAVPISVEHIKPEQHVIWINGTYGFDRRTSVNCLRKDRDNSTRQKT
jgi:hypothetical protein